MEGPGRSESVRAQVDSGHIEPTTVGIRAAAQQRFLPENEAKPDGIEILRIWSSFSSQHPQTRDRDIALKRVQESSLPKRKRERQAGGFEESSGSLPKWKRVQQAGGFEESSGSLPKRKREQTTRNLEN